MAVEGYVATVVVKDLASHGDALREAEFIKNCPYLLVAGVNGSTLTTVFMVPEEYRWWADYSALFPESRSRTFLMEEVVYPMSPREVVACESPPCGADCGECPQREQFNCRGCVATRKE